MQSMLRSIGQAVRIQPHPDIDPTTPVGEFFAQGPVSVIVGQARSGRAHLVIFADQRFLVVEDELMPDPEIRL